MKTGIQLIAEERHRQINDEGWTSEHDDQHDTAQLSGAAACYAIAANELASPVPYINQPTPSLWPWSLEWWKPGNDPVRCLVKAGALIAAEIDRLQRITNSTTTTPDPMNANADGCARQLEEMLASMQVPAEIRTPDHPEANGRKPQFGEQEYVFGFIDEDGRPFSVRMGAEGWRNHSQHVLDMLTEAPSYNDCSLETRNALASQLARVTAERDKLRRKVAELTGLLIAERTDAMLVARELRSEPVENPCSCSFPHLPHDWCDGSPAQTRMRPSAVD